VTGISTHYRQCDPTQSNKTKEVDNTLRREANRKYSLSDKSKETRAKKRYVAKFKSAHQEPVRRCSVDDLVALLSDSSLPFRMRQEVLLDNEDDLSSLRRALDKCASFYGRKHDVPWGVFFRRLAEGEGKAWRRVLHSLHPDRSAIPDALFKELNNAKQNAAAEGEDTLTDDDIQRIRTQLTTEPETDADFHRRLGAYKDSLDQYVQARLAAFRRNLAIRRQRERMRVLEESSESDDSTNVRRGLGIGQRKRRCSSPAGRNVDSFFSGSDVDDDDEPPPMHQDSDNEDNDEDLNQKPKHKPEEPGARKSPRTRSQTTPTIRRSQRANRRRSKPQEDEEEVILNMALGGKKKK